MKVLVVALFVMGYTVTFGQGVNELYVKASAQFERGSYDSAYVTFREVDALINHPAVNQFLIKCTDQLGLKNELALYLKKQQLQSADTTGFSKLVDTKIAEEYAYAYGEMLNVVDQSQQAFTLSDPGLHPESITYDSTSERFLIGSVRHGKIVSHCKDEEAIFAEGLLAVMGLVVDHDNKRLWAVTTNTEQMIKIDSSLIGVSKVHVFDLNTGELLKTWSTEEGNHFFGDLILGKSGEVIISDSRTPAFYQVTYEQDEIEELVLLDGFYSLQGLDWVDENTLAFSDYLLGLHLLDLTTLETRPVLLEDKFPLVGVDGLYVKDQVWTCIHNGTYPKRIVQYQLRNNMLKTIKAITNHVESHQEPTQGVWVGDEFYFIANSPWPLYDQKGIFEEKTVLQPLICKYEND
ncbi:MAG: hypothetical protein JXQ90_05830 [Cyclobacteriaceae bacterium]